MEELFLEKAREHLETGTSAEQSGDAKKAKKHYLKAAEYLFKAAKRSSGNLKAIRVANAEKLLSKAEGLHMPRREKIKDEEAGEKAFTAIRRPKISFDDVAGLDNVKEEIRVKLIYPFEHPEEAQKYGVTSGGGILLYGPPGTGKTYIAKAVAGEVDATFLSVKPSEVMSKWVGSAEQNIEKLFETARGHERAVIFIDEVEALIPKRRGSGSTVMQRVVPQILAEMDGVDSNNENLLFIAATNEPWSIDHAAMRPGRFDEKIFVPPPDYDARRRMFEMNLKGKPVSSDVNLDELATISEGYSGADIRQICIKASVIPFKESIETGVEREIEVEDFTTVLSLIKRSIEPAVLRKYEDFGNPKKKE